MGFPGGSDYKESTCSAGDLGSIPGLGRSPGEGHGNPLQYSCLESPHGQRKSQTQLSDQAHTCILQAFRLVLLNCCLTPQ